MRDEEKTKGELIAELCEIRERLAETDPESDGDTGSFTTATLGPAHFRRLLENAPVPMALGGPSGRILGCNQALADLLGYTVEELCSMTFQEFTHPDDVEDDFEKHSVLIQDGRGHHDLEKRYIRKDGAVVWANLFLTSARREPQGDTIAVGIVQDVTERKQEEARKRYARSELIRSVFAESVVGMALADMEGLFVRANQAFLDMLGYSEAEISRLTWRELCHPLDLERNEAEYRKLLEAGEGSAQLELRAVHKSGTPVWIHLTFTLLRDRDGSPTHVAGQTVDITARREAEAALRASENRFRSIVESSPVGIMMYRLEDDGRLVFEGANSTSDEILGVDNRQFIGKTIEEAFPPLAETEIPDRYRKAARGVPWETEQVDYEDEQIKGCFQVSAFPSSPGRMVVMFRDVTEDRRMVEALRESERKYRSLFDSANDALLILDPATEEVREANRRACETYGFSREEFLGMSLKDLTEDVESGESQLARVVRGESINNFNTVHTKKDGTRVQMLVNASLLSFDGRPAVLAVCRDMTKEKALEQQLRHSQKMEAIGRLAGGVAHDFNNILTVISGNVQLLARQVEEQSKEGKRLAAIRKASDHAAGLTRQLLAFGRRQVTDPRLIDVNRDLTGLLGMLGRVIGEDIRLETRFGPRVGHIHMDPGQLEQIFVNLVVNARDAMPWGGTLTLETAPVALDREYTRQHAYAEPGPYVRVAVTDTGEGMSEEVRAQVFEPFFTTKPGGSGLGLATVYGIVKQSGGSIEVRSRPEKGTTFEFFLPRVEKPLDFEPRSDEPDALARGAETVMVVEDEPEVEGLVVDVLSGLGYLVHSCGRPSKAEEMFGRLGSDVDLLLTDVVMPGKSGIDLAATLRAIRPDLRVLYMSGYTEEAILPRAAGEGRVNFLQKPFSLKDLAAKVREVLDRR